ncbi:MAG: RNase adapter RapZ [Proteobacteria bacterium]|nr:RNase adapter RapZ [Pseudomonadota bacterium]
MKLIIVSGRSGSGKSTALRTLEDAGYHCVDNLPVGLLTELLKRYAAASHSKISKVAVCIDARSAGLYEFPELLLRLREQGIDTQVLYLDALSPTLVKRFSETRRRHPLTSGAVDLREAIDREASVLASVADLASLTIDTTKISSKNLSEQIVNRMLENDGASVNLLFRSFGFKHGIPVDTDFVFDLRCLPNPHWHPGLRPLSGLHEEVVGFLQAKPLVNEMFDDIAGLLERWIPRFADNDRVYLTVGIGCTGGQHRSVYMAERLHKHFASQLEHVLVRHRELVTQ